VLTCVSDYLGACSLPKSNSLQLSQSIMDFRKT